MSRTKLAISYLLIVTSAILGVWLGHVATDSGDLRRWLGLTLLLAAAAGLVLIYRRDLSISAQDKELAWIRIKSRGKSRFVVQQMLSSQLIWVLPPLQWVIGWGLDIYNDHGWSTIWLPPTWWFALALLGAPFGLVYSLMAWRRLERKYST